MALADAVFSVTPAAAAMVGRTLAGQYEVVAAIGAGGMGVVYRAHQRALDRDVAVKVIRRGIANKPKAVLRFENEAKIISRLRHPNTIRVFDSGRTPEGDLFIVTELLSGRSVAQALKQGPLSFDDAAKILDQVCGSLAEAHAMGIIHRDIKPDNVFLDQVHGDVVAKVLDFGVAKLVDGEPITTAGAFLGTAPYISPEQVKREPVDHRTDIYSLGITMFEMLTGKVPFFSETLVELLHQHVFQPPPRLRSVNPQLDLPSGVEDLVASMLDKDPAQRPESMEAVRAALHEIRMERSVRRRAPALGLPAHLSPVIEAEAPTRVEPDQIVSAKAPAKSRLVAVGLLCALLAAGSLAYSELADREPAPPAPASPPRAAVVEAPVPPPPPPVEPPTELAPAPPQPAAEVEPVPKRSRRLERKKRRSTAAERRARPSEPQPEPPPPVKPAAPAKPRPLPVEFE